MINKSLEELSAALEPLDIYYVIHRGSNVITDPDLAKSIYKKGLVGLRYPGCAEELALINRGSEEYNHALDQERAVLESKIFDYLKEIMNGNVAMFLGAEQALVDRHALEELYFGNSRTLESVLQGAGELWSKIQARDNDVLFASKEMEDSDEKVVPIVVVDIAPDILETTVTNLYNHISKEGRNRLFVEIYPRLFEEMGNFMDNIRSRYKNFLILNFGLNNEMIDRITKYDCKEDVMIGDVADFRDIILSTKHVIDSKDKHITDALVRSYSTEEWISFVYKTAKKYWGISKKDIKAHWNDGMGAVQLYSNIRGKIIPHYHSWRKTLEEIFRSFKESCLWITEGRIVPKTGLENQSYAVLVSKPKKPSLGLSTTSELKYEIVRWANELYGKYGDIGESKLMTDTLSRKQLSTIIEYIIRDNRNEIKELNGNSLIIDPKNERDWELDNFAVKILQMFNLKPHLLGEELKFHPYLETLKSDIAKPFMGCLREEDKPEEYKIEPKIKKNLDEIDSLMKQYCIKGKLNIAVIEDREETFQALENYFRKKMPKKLKKHFKIDCFNSPQEAIEAFEAKRYDDISDRYAVVFTDIHMPISGFEVLDKAEEIFGEIPSMAGCGFTDLSTTTLNQLTGRRAYFLPKPYFPDEIDLGLTKLALQYLKMSLVQKEYQQKKTTVHS